MPFLAVVLITGIFGGIASGMFGVGGGAIFVPFMVMLLHYEPHLAIGTSLAVVIPTALISGFKYYSAGQIDWKTVAWLTAFSVLGAWFGAGLSLRLDAVSIKKYYALFLMGLSLKLFFSK